VIVRLDADAAVLPDRTVSPASVLIDDAAGTIVAAGAPRDIDHHAGAGGVEPLRVAGTLIPGFVELQINGAMSHDFRQADADGARTALAAILATGVTTCCPTVVTQPADRYVGSLRAIKAAAHVGGPRIAGVHLEGPFLAAAHKGAHHEPWLQAPDLALVEAVLAEAPVAIWTVAPELPGALETIRHLVAAGVTVSVGHTGSDDAALDAAVDAGLSMVTHLGNGMPPFHHRRPGPVGWALAHPSVRAGLVIDGHHLHPTVLGLFRALLGDRAFGVTDAIATLGLPPGTYDLGGMPLDTTTGVARLHGPDGTLAGATVGTDVMVRRLLGEGVPLSDVVRLCSENPADAIRRPDLGRIVPGCRADLLQIGADGAVAGIWHDGAPVRPSG
jgi:N-acetylglucosamine-6-phosphate deacetylase